MNPEDWKAQYLLTPYQEEAVEGFRAGEFVYMYYTSMQWQPPLWSQAENRTSRLITNPPEVRYIGVDPSSGNDYTIYATIKKNKNIKPEPEEPFYRNRLEEVE